VADSVAEHLDTLERFAFGGYLAKLMRLTTAGSSIGGNEFVFVRIPLPVSTRAS
jgi:hypothetical protein